MNPLDLITMSLLVIAGCAVIVTGILWQTSVQMRRDFDKLEKGRGE